jgi:hypothetical protein
VSEFGSCKLTTFTWIMFPLIYFNHWTIGPHFLFMMVTPGTTIILIHLFQTLCTFRLTVRLYVFDYDFDIGFFRVRVKDRIELTLFSAIFSIYIVLVLAKYTIRNIALICCNVSYYILSKNYLLMLKINWEDMLLTDEYIW